MVHIPRDVKKVHKLPPLDLLLGLIDSKIFEVCLLLVILIIDLVYCFDIAFRAGL